MSRRVFFSFHFDGDYWRTNQVRHIGAIEEQRICSANDWEQIKRSGDAAIERWIDDQMQGRSCVVALVGARTAERCWVLHELRKGWNDGKGVLAIRIDRLLDQSSQTSTAGANPLDKVTINSSGRLLSSVAQLKAPTGSDSKAVYASIANNIETWIEDAIRIRIAN